MDYRTLTNLISNCLGRHDVACPICGPDRQNPANRRRPVLRVWFADPGFISYTCARCGASGYARAIGRAEITPPRKAQPTPKINTDPARQRDKAQWLWQQSRSIEGTPARAYLRQRGITAALPATLRYLAPRKSGHRHALISAFCVPFEPVPGVLHVPAVAGIHLTLLKPDGSGKACTDRDKIMLGPSSGFPIVVAPMGESLALAVAEGIETALSISQASGLSTWAAGSAGRLPALAERIPNFVECVTIAAEPDDAGRCGAENLATRLVRRGVEVRWGTPK